MSWPSCPFLYRKQSGRKRQPFTVWLLSLRGFNKELLYEGLCVDAPDTACLLTLISGICEGESQNHTSSKKPLIIDLHPQLVKAIEEAKGLFFHNSLNALQCKDLFLQSQERGFRADSRGPWPSILASEWVLGAQSLGPLLAGHI